MWFNHSGVIKKICKNCNNFTHLSTFDCSDTYSLEHGYCTIKNIDVHENCMFNCFEDDIHDK